MENLYQYIPSFDELYKVVLQFIKDNQGEKGYIDVQDTEQNMWAIEYAGNGELLEETRVHAVRAKGDDIQLITEPIAQTYRLCYDEDDFKNGEWKSLRLSRFLYSTTLMEIADRIEDLMVEE